MVPEEEPVRLSGSQLAGILACPRQWFLSRQARAEAARSTAASFGSVIHVLADHGARTGADLAELTDHLDTVWRQLDFDANWLSAVERVEAESALERFVTWQQARTGSELLGTEVAFSCLVDLGGERIQLTGSADRVERDPDGRIRIVDFKTGRTPPTAADVALHDQLGVYQLAVPQGAFAEVAGPDARPGGAELVYLRLVRRPVQLPQGLHPGLARRPAVPAGSARAGPGRRAAGHLGAPAAGRRRRAGPDRTARGPGRARLPLLPVPRQLPGPAGRAAGGLMTCLGKGATPWTPAVRARTHGSARDDLHADSGSDRVGCIRPTTWSTPWASPSPTRSWTPSPRRSSPG